MIGMNWIVTYIVITDLLISLISVSCDKCTEPVTVGSLSHDNTIVEDKTYILAGYVIPHDGTVVSWEFCYQRSEATSVTFHPGIWRITDTKMNGHGDTDYELVKSNNITYDPSNTTKLLSCLTISLSVKDQIAVSAGSVVGLYSNIGSLLLRSNPDDSLSTYEYDGNQSMVMNARPNKKENVKFDITIRAHLVNGSGDKVFVGSLNHDIVDKDDTFILATNIIPCDGTVIAWEFCYQISNDTSATFYPGIWRISRQRGMGNDYELVRSSNVTFNPRGTSCQIFDLADTDQFVAPEGSFIGLYMGNTAPQLLHTDDMNTSITTFQIKENISSVNNLRPNNKDQDVNYNIAIRVHLGKQWLHIYPARALNLYVTQYDHNEITSMPFLLVQTQGPMSLLTGSEK